MLPLLATALLLGTTSAAPTATTTTTADCCDNNEFTNPSHLDRVVHNYLDAWNGQLGLVNSTFSPALTLQGDLFPDGSGGFRSIGDTVKTARDFGGFIAGVRASFASYEFTLEKWAGGSDRHVAARWKLDAVLGEGFALTPTSLKAGDAVTYNGTDFLSIDPCTGLVNEVAIAQDLLTFFVGLGNDIDINPEKE